MLKRLNFLGIVLTFIFLVGFVCAEYNPNDDPADLGGGWYGVSTCSQLQNMNKSLSVNYRLTGDIDCSDTVDWNDGKGFEPVGDCGSYNKCITQGQYDGKFFNGVFDGNGFVISDVFINRSEGDLVGLFGLVKDGNVVNVGLTNAYVNGNSMVGVLWLICGIVV